MNGCRYRDIHHLGHGCDSDQHSDDPDIQAPLREAQPRRLHRHVQEVLGPHDRGLLSIPLEGLAGRPGQGAEGQHAAGHDVPGPRSGGGRGALGAGGGQERLPRRRPHPLLRDGLHDGHVRLVRIPHLLRRQAHGRQGLPLDVLGLRPGHPVLPLPERQGHRRLHRGHGDDRLRPDSGATQLVQPDRPLHERDAEPAHRAPLRDMAVDAPVGRGRQVGQVPGVPRGLHSPDLLRHHLPRDTLDSRHQRGEW